MAGTLPPAPGSLEEKRGRGGPQNSDGGEEMIEESKKDCSHLLAVFNIYKSKENFNASGFFNGGLDTGNEPSLLAVDIDTKE